MLRGRRGENQAVGHGTDDRVARQVKLDRKVYISELRGRNWPSPTSSLSQGTQQVASCELCQVPCPWGVLSAHEVHSQCRRC